MDIQLDEFNLISFDIFDTLLFRAVSAPSDVFCNVWHRAKQEDPQCCDLSGEEFRKLRIEAERRARNRRESREVFLEDIYAEIPRFLCPNMEWLMKLELACEKECCYCNPQIYRLLQEAVQLEKKVVLLSDMYLTKTRIGSLLKANGIDTELFNSIIISCDHGCSKQSGKLYQVLKERNPSIPAKRMLHIGDNKNSDHGQALAAGLCAYHYDVIPDKLYSIYDYEKIRHNIPQKGLLSLRKLAASGYQGDDVQKKLCFELGASVVGPFLSLYITHVVERLKALSIHRIYPFMREGFLLGELLRKEAGYQGYELEVHPIYISRKVTYLPSIETVNREEIENLIGARNLTIAEAVLMVGLSLEDFPELKDVYDMPFKESHVHRLYGLQDGLTVKEHFIHRILEPQNVCIIERHIEAEREKLVSYLKQEIGDFEHIATIDIGFFGRIQMWMEKCLDLEGVPHQMKHFLAIGLVGDKVYDGIDFEGYYSTYAENMDLISTIHRTTDVLEKMISVPEGSTVGYGYEEGRKIVPQKGEALPNESFTDAIFAGVDEFQKCWFLFRSAKPQAADECLKDRRGALMLLHRLIDMPREEEASLFCGVKADTNFGTGYVKSVVTEENLKLLAEKGTDYIDKCNISYTYENSRIVWPKGVVTLGDAYYYVRRALKNSAGSEILKSMQEVVEKVQYAGITEVALYGAGENGRQFYFICRLYHLKVSCFIDRKESLWGTQKEGVPVMGIMEAMEKGKREFIITSLFSISEIKEYVEAMARDQGLEVSIYSV